MKAICDTEQEALAILLGENVFVRTVTFYYTGKLIGFDDKFLLLDDAAWIASTGRFSTALTTGKFDEVEPYPGQVFVQTGAVIDISKWGHELPRAQK